MLSLLPKLSHPQAAGRILFRFLMRRVLLAEFAILVNLNPVGIVLLVLVGPVVSVLANRTSQRDRVAIRTLGHPYALLTQYNKNKTRTKRR